MLCLKNSTERAISPISSRRPTAGISTAREPDARSFMVPVKALTGCKIERPSSICTPASSAMAAAMIAEVRVTSRAAWASKRPSASVDLRRMESASRP